MQPGLADTLQQKQPARKVGVNDNILSAELQEEAGVSDEGKAQLSVSRQLGLMRLSRAWSHRGMPYQTRKLARPLAQGGIIQGSLDHGILYSV